jgi:nucleoside-diphosphate-sugar epimerase
MIYATGRSGTIGRHLVNCFDLRLDLEETPFSSINFSAGEPSAVIHLGGIVGVEMVNSNAALANEVNVIGTIELAKYVRDFTSAKFIFVSTSHVYKQSNIKLREDSETHPISIYAKQKLKTEFELAEIFSSNPNRLLIARVFSVLGWSSNKNSLGGAIRGVLLDSNLGPVKNGADQRDFLSPKQVASTLRCLAVEKDAVGIVNVCTGRAISVQSASQVFAESMGLPHPEVKMENSAVPYLVGDNQYLLRLLQVDELSWNLDDRE